MKPGRKPMDPLTRIDKRSGDCWLWTGPRDKDGYGLHTNGKRAQRLVYELLVGPIPEDLVIDHLCRVRLCVNPDHMEPVTNAENLRRMHAAKTTCKMGHDLSVGIRQRFCRVCTNERNRKRYAKKKGAVR